MAVAKQPSKPVKVERSDEYERFEQTLRKLVSVPKRDIDAAVERERQARNNGSSK